MSVPALIGRYEVLHELGRGGMGVVVLARDSVLGRLVAIKFLRPDLELTTAVKEELVLRIKQEAKAAAALSHPNMVTLHDMGEDARIGIYLVFEYIEGPTLRDRLQSGPLAASDVARLARELGSALAHAHQAGVLHRDIKPENVMITSFGGKMTDFGVARIPDSQLTRAGTMLGTPAYSAPEALSGSRYSPRSDQFSLAATLYELLSGRPPFGTDDPMEVAKRVTSEEPPPLSHWNPDFVRADYVLQRALSKDPDKRFASALELGESLAGALTTRERLTMSILPPESSRTSSIVPRATRRSQNMIAALALLIIVALIALGRRSDRSKGVSLREAASSFSQAITKAPWQPVPTPPPKSRPPSNGQNAAKPTRQDAAATVGATEAGTVEDAGETSD